MEMECQELLEECSVILTHAPSINKLLLVGRDKPFHPYLHKMRQIAVNTKKANFTEVEKVYKIVGRVYYVFGVEK